MNNNDLLIVNLERQLEMAHTTRNMQVHELQTEIAHMREDKHQLRLRLQGMFHEMMKKVEWMMDMIDQIRTELDDVETVLWCSDMPKDGYEN